MVNHTGVIDRTNSCALRTIEMPDAFGAFLRINDEGSTLLGNCDVGTLGLAGRATGAL